MDNEPPSPRRGEVPTDASDERGPRAPDEYRGPFSSPIGCCFLILLFVILFSIVIIVALGRNFAPSGKVPTIRHLGLPFPS